MEQIMSDSNELYFRMPWSKRIFDLVAACCALLFLSPILFLAIIAIRIESKGKVIYRSSRMGRRLDVFYLYKLRSMYVGGDKDLEELLKKQNQCTPENRETAVDFSLPCPQYAARILNDPRITRVGKFIRNTGIDNIPQLINVIRGDMSIVGNRPLPVYEAVLMTRGEMGIRFLAPAGIIGLWQVEQKAFNGLIPEEQRMQLDNEYASHYAGDNYSFFYDMKLIVRTVRGWFSGL